MDEPGGLEIKTWNTLLPALGLLFVSCASDWTAVSALEEVHKERSPQAVQVDQARYAGFLEYATIFDEDELEDPVAFCLDHIEDLAEEEYAYETEKFEPVFVLCVMARRSPSKLVRTRSLRALCDLAGHRIIPYEMHTTSPAPEDVEAHLLRLNALLEEGEDQTARFTVWQQFVLTEMQFFGSLAMGHTDAVWNVMRKASSTIDADRFDADLQPDLEAAFQHLSQHIVFLAVHDAMVDPEEVVRQEAIILFFLFPWDAINKSLSLSLERNLYLKAPLHKILVLEMIKDKKDRPEKLDLKVMNYIIESLRYQAHAGVVNHGVQLLKEITGLEENDPGFWLIWWDEYLLEHADD
ncbi:MAG: hypothetical protein ACYTG7_02350 [Planctomycetota bacterium]|jgi:hypothetical protein